MKFLENSVSSPASAKAYAHGPKGSCPRTPKTFINDGTCIQRRKSVCTSLTFRPDTFITLDADTIRKFYLLSEKYVYVVTGLICLETR
jgi:hypothetical protein